MVVVGIAFAFLGRWQLGVAESRSYREAVEQARAQEPAALTSVLEPHAPFRGDLSLRPMTAQGSYAPVGQVLVPDRRLDGVSGSWVLTPFVVEGSGATIAVVRGFVTNPADAGAPPSGPLTIAGGLAPGESPSSVPVAAGEIGSIDLSLLVNTWPGELYNAFVFLESETPQAAGQPTRVPTPLPDTSIQWRNAAYAVQWWVFAFSALWVWSGGGGEETRREALLEAPGDTGSRDDA